MAPETRREVPEGEGLAVQGAVVVVLQFASERVREGDGLQRAVRQPHLLLAVEQRVQPVALLAPEAEQRLGFRKLAALLSAALGPVLRMPLEASASISTAEW